MSKSVRFGVIGAGMIANNIHLPSLKSHPQATLTAICSRTLEHAAQAAKRFEIPHVFTDYRQMLETAELDAVVIATPDDLHYPMAMDALDAGLHVLCEKPLALNAAQALEMVTAAEAAGVVHMVFFAYRWRPSYCYLKELVDEGYIGRPYHCHLHFLGGYGRHPYYGWRFDRQHGTGILGDLGSHMIDLARWTIGDIARVSAQISTFVERPGSEGEDLDPANDAAMLLLEFENGAQGSIQVSAVAHTADRVQEQRMVLHGESGTLELDYSFLGSDFANGVVRTPCELRGARARDGQFQSIRVPDRLWENADRENAFSVFQTQPAGPRAFVDAILAGQTGSPNFHDGYRAQQVIDAAFQSHREGTWVSIPA